MANPAANGPAPKVAITDITAIRGNTPDKTTLNFKGKLNGLDVYIQIKSRENLTPTQVKTILENSFVTKTKSDESGQFYKAELKNAFTKITIKHTDISLAEKFKALKDQNLSLSAKNQRVLSTSEKAFSSAKEALGKLKDAIKEGPTEVSSGVQERLTTAKDQASQKAKEAKTAIASFVGKTTEKLTRKSTQDEYDLTFHTTDAGKAKENAVEQRLILKEYFRPSNFDKSKKLHLNVDNNGNFFIAGKKSSAKKAVMDKVLEFLKNKVQDDIANNNRAELKEDMTLAGYLLANNLKKELPIQKLIKSDPELLKAYAQLMTLLTTEEALSKIDPHVEIWEKHKQTLQELSARSDHNSKTQVSIPSDNQIIKANALNLIGVEIKSDEITLVDKMKVAKKNTGVAIEEPLLMLNEILDVQIRDAKTKESSNKEREVKKAMNDIKLKLEQKAKPLENLNLLLVDAQSAISYERAGETIVQNMFKEYCNKVVKTYHPTADFPNLESEHKSWNVEAQRLAAEQGLPEFIRDREEIEQLLHEDSMTQGTKNIDAVMSKIKAFMDKYPANARVDLSSMGTPLPSVIFRNPDGTIKPNEEANISPEQAKEWDARWGKQKKA